MNMEVCWSDTYRAKQTSQKKTPIPQPLVHNKSYTDLPATKPRSLRLRPDY
jgi:hypothetical protein